jgi:hypothetical protein
MKDQEKNGVELDLNLALSFNLFYRDLRPGVPRRQ